MAKGGAAQANNAVTGIEKWRECMNGDRPWEKDLLLDTLHWIRQIIGVALGVVFGLLGLTGGIPFIIFFACSIGGGVVFYRSLRIDEDDYGGHQILGQEGVAPALSLFLVLWISIYSTLHA